MRISKPPEERKQEMIDTAMQLFLKKGYEATTMTDIAREMHVVSGLCYRYFSSKEELYHTVLDQYAGECAALRISLLNQDFESLEEYLDRMSAEFMKTDKHEKYHDFFHETGNEMFHDQLEKVMLRKLEPYVTACLERLQKRGSIRVDNCRDTARIILYGQMPIINDDTLETKEKIEIINAFIKKMLLK